MLSTAHCVPRKPESFYVVAQLQIPINEKKKKGNSLHPGNMKQLGRRNIPHESVFSVLNGNRIGGGGGGMDWINLAQEGQQ
jgi:hypothetical protein